MNYNIVEMETFGKWLLRHRKALGITQGEVARKARVSVSYVSTLEREQPHSITGEEISPDRDKVARLAKAVNGSVGEALKLRGFTSDSENSPPFIKQIDWKVFSSDDLTEIENFIAFKAVQALERKRTTLPDRIPGSSPIQDFEGAAILVARYLAHHNLDDQAQGRIIDKLRQNADDEIDRRNAA